MTFRSETDGGLDAAPVAPMLLSLNPMVGEKRTGSRRMWTVREERVLRETYPAGGTAACLPLLPFQAQRMPRHPR